MNNSSLISMLNGISKTLNIAKNVIPIYEDAKPLINGAKNMYQKLSKNSTSIRNNLAVENKKVIIDYPKNSLNVKISSEKKTNNGPVFFI